jgi:hypothetical protein
MDSPLFVFADCRVADCLGASDQINPLFAKAVNHYRTPKRKRARTMQIHACDSMGCLTVLKFVGKAQAIKQGDRPDNSKAGINESPA